MMKLGRRYAAALMDYANEQGLQMIYQQALSVVTAIKQGRKDPHPEEIGQFLELVPRDDWEEVLFRFLDLARECMNLNEAEVISAVPLTGEQMAELERKLIRLSHKQINLTNTVDPSVLGGVRVIVDNMVLDETVERKLADMKDHIYRGVYLGII